MMEKLKADEKFLEKIQKIEVEFFMSQDVPLYERRYEFQGPVTQEFLLPFVQAKPNDYKKMAFHFLMMLEQKSCHVFWNGGEGTLQVAIISPKYNYFMKTMVKKIEKGFAMQFSFNNEIKSACKVKTDLDIPFSPDSFLIKYSTGDTSEEVLHEKFKRKIMTQVEDNIVFTFSVHKKLFMFPKNLNCFFDEGLYRVTGEKKLIIWLFNTSTLFLQSVLHFHNKKVTLFNAACSEIYIDVEKNERCKTQTSYQDIKLSKLEAEGFKVDMDKLSYKVISNFNEYKVQRTDVVTEPRRVMLPRRDYGKEFVQEEAKIFTQYMVDFGGFIFYYLRKENTNLGTYFFFFAQNRHQYSFYYKSINDMREEGDNDMTKNKTLFNKGQIVSHPNDNFELQIQMNFHSLSLPSK